MSLYHPARYCITRDSPVVTEASNCCNKLSCACSLWPSASAASCKRLVAGFPPRRPGFDPRSGHVGFVVDKVALGQIFSEYFGFPCQSSFHRLLHNHPRSSGTGTIGQQWPTYQLDSVSPHPEKLKKKEKRFGDGPCLSLQYFHLESWLSLSRFWFSFTIWSVWTSVGSEDYLCFSSVPLGKFRGSAFK
jgi:hypothetical protein